VDAQLFYPQGAPGKIPCRRSQLYCWGSFACESIDPTLKKFTCYELDTSSHDALHASKRESHMSLHTCSARVIMKVKLLGMLTIDH
jgi:hypothetical protein